MNEQVQKYFLGTLSESERMDLLNHLQCNPLLKEEFIRWQNTVALSQLSEFGTNTSEAKKSYTCFLQKVNRIRIRELGRNTLKYAAIALLLITSTIFLTLNRTNQKTDNIALNTLYVPAGQRAQLTLEDGTTVWLNAKSTLTYPAKFSKKERRISVIGEAYFDVTENERKPFVVSTQGVDLKVLGTQFNVYSYPDAGYIQTDLVKGSLKVYDAQSEKTGIILKPSEQVIIKKGKMVVEKIQNSSYFLWKDGIYAFENEKLSDILEKLQLYYDVKITVKDPEIFNVKYTGKFRQRDGIDQILRMIQKIHKFNVKKDPENNIITLTK